MSEHPTDGVDTCTRSNLQDSKCVTKRMKCNFLLDSCTLGAIALADGGLCCDPALEKPAQFLALRIISKHHSPVVASILFLFFESLFEDRILCHQRKELCLSMSIGKYRCIVVLSDRKTTKHFLERVCHKVCEPIGLIRFV